ncbi:sugar phosphate isomerase/epimerase family protein [Thalassomonas haliotis]|uniref:Sugar phosphate isomerase/epimerase n=1 Tax=Thalassomonas haliotis TaxID=485448 RepID=A0ABY7VF75_9GAMM|nr:TIM barrel protein [Thalassomonas haliotis]WDE12120.1 sugar phosphate isomerase/epimerase [Thalassomonas haliotis]
MQLSFHKSFWEAQCSNEQELNGLLAKVKQEGYQGTELFLPFYPISSAATLKAHQAHDLAIITGIGTDGETPQQHLQSLERQVEQAMAFNPKFINCHTGRDIFSLDDNLKIFNRALELEKAHGINITHETHRFRPTFNTLTTEAILNALPQLKLNLDISHWMVVHESDLSDQQARVDALLKSAFHVHARVGYEEGPQVTDPQDPCWQTHLDNHTRLWQSVVNNAAARQEKELTITPEFGPFPYAHVKPHSEQTLTDIWQANYFIKQHLEQELQIPA